MNKKFGFLLVLTFAAAAISIVSCRKTNQPGNSLQELSSMPTVYNYINIDRGGVIQNLNNLRPKSNLPGSEIDITDHTVTLGRVLFYDRRLSINNTVACASCHQQNKAFADGMSISTGFADKSTTRNSMAIINPIQMNNLFWDSRSQSALDLSTRPVFNHIEMGMESAEMLEQKIAKTSFYSSLFTNAFGDNNVSMQRISVAISHFLDAMITNNSKFDEGEKTDFANFSKMELLGKDLFNSERLNCTSCHAGVNFSAADFPGGPYGAPTVKGTANIGLNMIYKDNGNGNGSFRIPSLRNVELTGPYMHDGRFATLDEVVEHYNSGIQPHPNLDKNLIVNGVPRKLNLNAIEKDALVAFLKTFTDKSYISDIRYSNPFRN